VEVADKRPDIILENTYLHIARYKLACGTDLGDNRRITGRIMLKGKSYASYKWPTEDKWGMDIVLRAPQNYLVGINNLCASTYVLFQPALPMQYTTVDLLRCIMFC
jgi:hypothetical protein